MPRIVDVALPPWADHALAVLSGRATMAILLALATHPQPIAQHDLPGLTGLSAQTTSDALRRLEDAGIAHGSLSRNNRRGHSLEWRLDQPALTDILNALIQGLTPTQHPQT